jgi:catechol 2,3-dioxygenase-like lactoylglutathione lyase family enzyme
VDHHHGRIGDPNLPPGNGVLLWFEVDDFDAALARAEGLQAKIVLPRHRNPPDHDDGPNHWEVWLRDPDGYTVGARQSRWNSRWNLETLGPI